MDTLGDTDLRDQGRSQCGKRIVIETPGTRGMPGTRCIDGGLNKKGGVTEQRLLRQLLIQYTLEMQTSMSSNYVIIQNMRTTVRVKVRYATFTMVRKSKKAFSKACVPSMARTLVTCEKKWLIVSEYFEWISRTRASRLRLPAPPISAALASNLKWLVV